MKPNIPRTNEPIRAKWARELIDWIESIRPKGDRVTTKVSPEGFVTAFVSAAPSSIFADAEFVASLKSGTTDTIAINAGRLIRGTSVTAISQTDHELTISTGGTHYVYLESWYNSTAKEQYSSSTTYPNQAAILDAGSYYFCERFLIATVETVYSGSEYVISRVIPEQLGELRSTRLWE